MTSDRHLDWDGCCNVRDLGGLRTDDGRHTRWGAIVRADNLARLTAAGWAALWAYGIRTVIDLRDDEERADDAALRPPGLTTVHAPLNVSADTAFMQEYGHLGSTPLFFQHVLAHRPAQLAAVIAAVARAPQGGVAYHCVAGRDRTGIAAVLTLTLGGVTPADIAADYALSAARLRPLYARLGRVDEDLAARHLLARAGTTAEGTIATFLAALDIAAYLRAAGLRAEDLAAIRTRLLGPEGGEILGRRATH